MYRSYIALFCLFYLQPHYGISLELNKTADLPLKYKIEKRIGEISPRKLESLKYYTSAREEPMKVGLPQSVKEKNAKDPAMTIKTVKSVGKLPPRNLLKHVPASVAESVKGGLLEGDKERKATEPTLVPKKAVRIDKALPRNYSSPGTFGALTQIPSRNLEAWTLRPARARESLVIHQKKKENKLLDLSKKNRVRLRYKPRGDKLHDKEKEEEREVPETPLNRIPHREMESPNISQRKKEKKLVDSSKNSNVGFQDRPNGNSQQGEEDHEDEELPEVLLNRIPQRETESLKLPQRIKEHKSLDFIENSNIGLHNRPTGNSPSQEEVEEELPEKSLNRIPQRAESKNSILFAPTERLPCKSNGDCHPKAPLCWDNFCYPK